MPDLVLDQARRRAGRQHPVVGETELHAEERRAEGEKQRDHRQADPYRPPHDEQRDPMPRAFTDRPRRVMPQHELLHARPERREHGGENNDRTGRRDRYDRDTRVSERAEEEQREDEQRRQRNRDGNRAEQDRASRGLDRPNDGGFDRAPPSNFLAVPRDDEQGVVDPETDAQAGRDVQGEDRHVRHRRDDPQDEQRPDDGEDRDDQGQAGSDGAAEHEDQEDEHDRERDRLGLAKILLDPVADLLEDGRLTADHNRDRLVRARVLRRQLAGSLANVVVGAGDVGEHEGLRAVLAVERRWRTE